MEIFTPNFSMKNIPFPSECQFVLSLTDRIVDFIKRIWWKTFFFYNPGMEDNEQKYNFKSLKIPPNKKMLEQFEDNLFKFVKKIKFKSNNDEFKKTLKIYYWHW